MTDHVPCTIHGTARSAGWATVSNFCWSGKPFARHLGMQFTTVMAEDNAEQVGLAFVVLPSVQTRNTALCTLHADLPVHLSVY